MMRLLESTRLEDCFDGSAMYRYRTDQPWTREAIQSLAQFGELDSSRFPRPYHLCGIPANFKSGGWRERAYAPWYSRGSIASNFSIAGRSSSKRSRNTFPQSAEMELWE